MSLIRVLFFLISKKIFAIFACMYSELVGFFKISFVKYITDKLTYSVKYAIPSTGAYPEIRNGGGCFGGLGAEPPAARGWGSRGKAPAAGGTEVWGQSPQRSIILHFFAKIIKFRAIVIKNNAVKTWYRNWQCNMIQLVALMGYVGGG